MLQNILKVYSSFNNKHIIFEDNATYIQCCILRVCMYIYIHSIGKAILEKMLSKNIKYY